MRSLPPPPPDPATLASLRNRWTEAWPAALAAWSKFTRLRPPNLCLTETEARHEGLSGSFAMIRLQDQSIVVSLPQVVNCRVEGYGLEKTQPSPVLSNASTRRPTAMPTERRRLAERIKSRFQLSASMNFFPTRSSSVRT